jgi:hypothetical protein
LKISTDWVENLQSELKVELASFINDLNYYTTPPIEERFANIRSVIERLDPIKENKPIFCADRYKKEWERYVSGKEHALNHRTIRKLCWEPEVATDKRFFQCIMDSDLEITARSIRGLVYSAHMKWSTLTKDWTSARKLLGEQINKYNGKNKWLGKWKGIADQIINWNGAELFAYEIVNGHLKIAEAYKERNLFRGTEYFHKNLCFCIDILINKISSGYTDNTKKTEIEYLTSEILSLEDLPYESFKDGMAQLILIENLTLEPELVEIVKNYAIRNKKLGDPRLSRNGVRWAGIDEKAKSKIIEWLSRADIIFFFDNVLPPGADKHGRKEFWLRYVKNFVRTRCLLRDEDRARLIPMFRRLQVQVESYGSVMHQWGSSNSAFILDFGPVLAVEFSQIGACYIYDTKKLPRSLNDFWTPAPFSESALKSQPLSIARITHHITRNRNWQDNLSHELARLGIRPI